MKKILVLIAASFLSLSMSAQRHDKDVLRRAENGDAQALYDLGRDYYYGHDGREREKLGYEYFRKAAELGHVEAIFKVGYCYEYDFKSDAEATKWYMIAAVLGHAEACARVGSAYYVGYGVESNEEREFYWNLKGVEKGSTLAMLHLKRQVGSENSKYFERAYDATWDDRFDDVYDNLYKFSPELAENYKNGTESNYGFPDYKQELIEKIIADGGSHYLVSLKNVPTFSNKKVVVPPIIQIVPGSVNFADADHNLIINANDSAYIAFQVHNAGKGPGIGCVANVTTDAADIKVKNQTLKNIAPGATEYVIVPVTSGMNVVDGSAKFDISVSEPNGFGSETTNLTVETHAFEAPLLKVVDYAVSNESGTQLKKVDPFDITLMLQNVDYGTAENVNVSLQLPQGVFMMAGEPSLNLNSMEGGDKKTLKYTLIANNNYNSETIPVTISVKEKYGKYAESRTITLAMNQQMVQNNNVVVNGVEAKPRSNIEIAKLDGSLKMSDVDMNIPHNAAVNKNTFAVIIANENYVNESKVDFAINDGTSFARYCTEVLGVPSENIRLRKDATFGAIRGDVSWLKKVSEAYDDAELIFYYAGHGVPDEKSKDAYLLPTDGMGSDLATAYRMEDLYNTLSQCRSKRTLVFLDACFSGKQRSGMEMASARAVGISTRKAAPKGNMVVFSAAQGDETAYPYSDKKHGMFTYFLLKKLQESKGNVTLGDLGSYIRRNVLQKSVVKNSKAQTPSVDSSASMKDSWQKMKM